MGLKKQKRRGSNCLEVKLISFRDYSDTYTSILYTFVTFSDKNTSILYTFVTFSDKNTSILHTLVTFSNRIVLLGQFFLLITHCIRIEGQKSQQKMVNLDY